VDGRRRDVEAHRTGRYTPDRVDPCRPARSQFGLRRGAGAFVRPECGARRVSLNGWRRDVEEDFIQGRKHRRDRFGVRPAKYKNDLRGAVADAAASMERLSAVEWPGKWALQINRRRRQVDAAYEWTADGRAGANWRGGGAEQFKSRVRDCRCERW